MEPCKVCGRVARYILDDGSVACAACVAHVADSTVKRPTGCRVFSATRAYDREHLGEHVTAWIRANNVTVTEAFVAQSSDNSFHCVTMVVFYRSAGDA